MLPTPFFVETRAYDGGGVDAHGSEIVSWASPVRQPVFGWSVPSSSEPKLAGHNRVVVQIELLAPPAFRVGPYDKVIVPGHGELDVLGVPEDFTHGPFGFMPGLVVNLGKVDG